MNLITHFFTLFKSSLSTDNFYKGMNHAFSNMYGEYCMLHYPLYKDEKDNLLQGQMNLTDYCVSKLPSLKNKKVLDISCGNGIQSIYLRNNFSPKHIIGIDFNSHCISIAENEKKNNKLDNIDFYVDNAQNLSKIDDNSIDIVFNIESAFHYPDKVKFINAISRVLKPDGCFLIADIITTKKNKRLLPFTWHKKNMNYHHWTVNDYIRTFFNSGLSINLQDDITESVINGFKTYKNWFQNKRSIGIILYTFIKLFIIVNVKINVFLLKSKRKYIIFTGMKS